MLKVEKVGRTNRQRTIDRLKSDIVKHVFAYYDLQRDPKRTTMYIAEEGKDLRGYILIYTGTDVPSVDLECDDGAAEILISYAPQSNFIIHAPPNLKLAALRAFPNGNCYLENWMVVKKGKANFFKSEFARKLSTRDDASKLAELLSNRQDRPKHTLKRYVEWVSGMPIQGIFLEDRLVSYAASFIQLPEIWMIGGVYTHTLHRNKGYATLAVSAITEEALNQSDAAALFVRADNVPAIRVYEKIGYRKIGEKIWVDVGTGLRP
jgi:RimJ/RimL family protein N-acetyltransferase